MCSLTEAFSTFSGSDPEPRNADLDKKHRKKSRKTLAPPEPLVIEPDRPAHRPLPPAELLGGGPTENTKSTSISSMLNAFDQADDYFPVASTTTEDPNIYRLEPDWTKTFYDNSAPEWIKQRLPSRDAEVPLVPSPWLDGASTLWQKIPESQRIQANLEGAADAANRRIDELQKKLDDMFKKIDDLEVTRSESNHLEVILFILGGIFLILMLDLLVKQGTRATMMIATAGGAMVRGRFAKSMFF